MTDKLEKLRILEKYNKKLVALRYFLIGKGFHDAVAALDFAQRYHTGTRKDNITPEFYHQICIASYIRTLPLPDQDLEIAITTAILHDVVEDYDVSIEEIRKLFGHVVAEPVRLVTNAAYGIKIPKDLYYANISMNVIAAIAKGSDRMNNIQTMTGVFSTQKQLDYINEVKTYILPMLKLARRRFPKYEAAIENIKHVLQSQIELIGAALGDRAKLQQTPTPLETT